jgi:hypothetical protein
MIMENLHIGDIFIFHKTVIPLNKSLKGKLNGAHRLQGDRLVVLASQHHLVTTMSSSGHVKVLVAIQFHVLQCVKFILNHSYLPVSTTRVPVELLIFPFSPRAKDACGIVFGDARHNTISLVLVWPHGSLRGN